MSLSESKTDAYQALGQLTKISLGTKDRYPRELYFLKGGILISWIYALMQLPGKALPVALELRFQCDLKKTDTVKFSCSQLTNMGVSRDSALRAINTLEQNGFISTERKRGCKIVVKILPKKSGPIETPNIT